MTETKMLQIIINGQVELKKQIDTRFKEVQENFKQVDENFKKVNVRIDSIGKSLAYLLERQVAVS
jgi:hypothetical protein